MKNIYQAILLAFVLAVPFFAFGQMKHVPGEMLVQITPGYDAEDALADLRVVSGEVTGISLGELLSAPMNIYRFYFYPDFTHKHELLETVRRAEGVSLAQFNHYVHPRDTIIPNDPEFDGQWHHLNTGQTNGTVGSDISSTAAWDITTGGLTAHGDTIVVCVIEGGNLNHPDLQENAWVNNGEIPGDGIDNDGNGYVDDYLGWNVNSLNDEGVFDGNHGTQVMGMIGAKGDNEMGVAGINWNVKIMSVAGESLGNEASVVAAYTYPLVQRQLYDDTEGDRGAFVVATNASWGIDNGNIDEVPIWKAFYDTLGVYGILNCGATANNNVDIDVVGDIPTAAPSDYMVSVTATNHNDIRTFSAYGVTTVDFAAPGASVLTTTGQQGYNTTSGTSFASPLTAGVIALMYSVPCESFMDLVKDNPQLGADYVRYALMEGVDPVEGLQGFLVTGGRVNAHSSVSILQDNCGETLCLPPFAFNYTLASDTVYTFTWNAADTLGVAIRYRLVGEEEWTVVEDIEGSSFEFVAEELCANYEFEIASVCSATEDGYNFGSTRFFESKGCCIAPQVLEVIDVDTTSAQIAWSTDFALEFYEVYYRELGTSEWMLVGIFADGLGSLDGLNGCTDYEVLVKPSCEEGFEDAAIVEGIKTLDCGPCIDLNFCENRAENSFWEFIDVVEIGDLEFVTGNNGGYALFEDTGIELEAGQDYVVTLTPGFSFGPYNEFFRVWIDFNADGLYSADELVMSSVEGSSEVLSDTITISDEAIVGSTRMRIAMKFVGNSGNVVEACELFDEGETEDYCVAILSSTLGTEEAENTGQFGLFPNPNTGLFQLKVGNLPEAYMNGPLLIEVYDIAGKMLGQQQVQPGQNQINYQHLDAGMYMYTVRHSNSNTTLYSDKFVLSK